MQSAIVKLGPWGGQGNVTWAFQSAEGAGLKHIVVNSGALVDAITFTVDDGTGRTSKMKFGGDGGTPNTVILLTVEIEGKLKQILKRLVDLIENSEVLGLKKGMEDRRLSANRETTSLPDEIDGFYGRDGDKEAIKSLLFSDDANAGNLGVIPIVGMGGIGKTTLAQHVFNDEEVAKQFNVRGWICVSVEFTVLRLTKLILEEVTGTAPDSNNLNRLQRDLKGELDGKKFLLVLDDVWSEDYNGWNKLLIPLRYGGKGSKIIITTRSKDVASKVQTVPTHDLRVLGDEDCWKLFARHACLDVNFTANPHELQEIGKKIVRKCGGLPLAAKALGGVLRRQTEAGKWKKVLKSEIWDVQNAKVLPSLAMSYIDLPSHLKRCFAYCAIFPQDYRFHKEELVALWMSEGFLVQQKGNQSSEEIGDMYFDDLVSRSFFQPKGYYFVMHDLVHDLARFVSREFCSRMERGISWKIGERTRHVSCKRYMNIWDWEEHQDIHKVAPFLRSFVLVQPQYVHCNDCLVCIDNGIMNGLLTRKWNLLRVLCLSCGRIRELPNSIGNLKHICHLDFSYTSIESLPEAVTTLLNLKVLIMRECWRLVELPADMARLINLCQLDITDSYKLKGMPPEMGKLKKLSKLSDFVVGKNGGSSIKELGHLHYLRGQIFIRGLENVKGDRDAFEAILKDKENLKVLALSWNGNVDDSRQVKQVLERLQPHMQIENIRIWSYRGTEFPKWIGDISYSKLKQLWLRGCGKCICLPSLGQLASLEVLIIDGDYNEVLEAIGLEFYGTCKPGENPFSSLKTLEIQNMLNWREWSSCNGAFPVLEALELHGCPELLSVPAHLPSLKRLWIDNCHKVKCMPLETFPNLRELKMENCYSLESLVGPTAATRESDPLFLTSLTSLTISGCSKLESFPRGGLHAPNLKSMIIEECDNLKSLPQGMHSFLSSLEKLRLRNCPKPLSVPTHLPGLKDLSITGCGELDLENLLISTCATLETIEIWGNEKVKCISVETFPNLKGLDISHCSNLESLVGPTAATRTSDPWFSPSLTSLHLEGCSELVSFPREGLHAPNLKGMTIGERRNLKSLPQGTHSLVSSLENLELRNCPKLLSVATHLPGLKNLSVTGCGELDVENLLISTCASLENIYISGVEKVKCISVETFPNLKELEIWGSNLESLGSTTTTGTSDPLLSPSLTELHIEGCSELVSFPMGGLHAPNLKSMIIQECDNLKSLPQGMHSLLPSLQTLSISNCPEIQSFPDGGLPSKLLSLEIERCEKLVGGRMQWGLQSLPCLLSIRIEGESCEDDVESSFPEETLLPSSLRHLAIGGFAKMKSLNYKGLQHLTSLESLKISNCENLGSLPKEKLLSSLSSLVIEGCQLLKKRCERGRGKYWPKIKHIRDVRID